MTTDALLSFILALFFWLIIPGPAVFAIVGRALTSSLGAAFRLIAGILLGDLFYMSLVFMGLTAVGRMMGEFFIIVRVLAACYLIYLGVRLWRADPDRAFQNPDGNEKGFKLFLAGFGITLGNPKAILFHMGFLPAFFDLSMVTGSDALLIMAVFTTVLGSGLSLYALAAARARRFVTDRYKMKLLNRVSGSVMIGAGAAIAVRE